MKPTNNLKHTKIPLGSAYIHKSRYNISIIARTFANRVKTTGTLIIYLTIAREYMAAHLVLKFSTYPMGLISVHHGTVSPQYSI